MTIQSTTEKAAGLTFDLSGQGPPLVLLHGLGSSSRAFAPVVPALCEVFTTYVVDLPGHGRSPLSDHHGKEIAPGLLARDVGAWMDAVGLDRAHLVGNSMGGWVALELAADGRAHSVVALSPAGLWTAISRRSPLMDVNRSIAKLTRPVAPVISRSALLRNLGFRYAVERTEMLTPELTADAARDLAGARGYDAAHDGMVHRSFDRSEEIPEQLPVVIAFGDNDRIIPSTSGRERQHSPIQARWVTLERCGHVPMWDVPDVTVALIRDTAGV